MKKRLIISLALLLLLSTYNLQNKFELINPKLIIKKIIVENNEIVSDKILKRKLSFLYETNLFLLNSKSIQNSLNKVDFIDSFEIKKIYPNTIKIKVFEKIPIAILQNKNTKSYYTKSGDVINYIESKKFEKLPIVFGNKENFKIIYENLKKLNFPLKDIKTFLFFESKRWDLVTNQNKTIKLPIKNYKKSLENFMSIKDQYNFKKYKSFDYRINNQLILK